MTDPIKHVIWLMLENRSFDHMLGSMQQLYPDVDGVFPTPPEDRTNTDTNGKEFHQAATTDKQMQLDPKHEVERVLAQLDKNNSGFVSDFATQYPQSTDADRQNIMGFYQQPFLPALHTLARDFTICDRWFSSLPGPTWPNRFFALSGTSNGRADMPNGPTDPDLQGFFQQDQSTLFDRLNEAKRSWKVYYYDFPVSLIFTRQRHPENLCNYRFIDHFYTDVKDEATFPDFVFLEPKYAGLDQNDDHPPHNIMKGEKLIADLFNAIRSNDDLWASTLFIVAFDEHGGFYDHVSPPAAVNPDGRISTKPAFGFDRLGVRVPALLISPYTRRRVEHTVFDHTSVLKYLTDKWNLGSLGRRTANANSIGIAIAQERATSLRVSYTDLIPDNPEFENKDLTEHHGALSAMASFLTKEEDTLQADVMKGAAGQARIFTSLQDTTGKAAAAIGNGLRNDLEAFVARDAATRKPLA